MLSYFKLNCLQYCVSTVYSTVLALSTVLCQHCLQYCVSTVYSTVSALSTVLCQHCLQYCVSTVYSTVSALSTVLCQHCLQYGVSTVYSTVSALSTVLCQHCLQYNVVFRVASADTLPPASETGPLRLPTTHASKTGSTPEDGSQGVRSHLRTSFI